MGVTSGLFEEISTDTYPFSSMTLAHSHTLRADYIRPPHFAIFTNPYQNLKRDEALCILQGIGSPSTWLSDGEKLFVPSFCPRLRPATPVVAISPGTSPLSHRPSTGAPGSSLSPYYLRAVEDYAVPMASIPP